MQDLREIGSWTAAIKTWQLIKCFYTKMTVAWLEEITSISEEDKNKFSRQEIQASIVTSIILPKIEWTLIPTRLNSVSGQRVAQGLLWRYEASFLTVCLVQSCLKKRYKTGLVGIEKVGSKTLYILLRTKNWQWNKILTTAGMDGMELREEAIVTAKHLLYHSNCACKFHIPTVQYGYVIRPNIKYCSCYICCSAI